MYRDKLFRSQRNWMHVSLMANGQLRSIIDMRVHEDQIQPTLP